MNSNDNVESDKSKNSYNVVILLVIIMIISKVLSFFREIILSYYFGATGISDAYLISQNIPGTIFTFVGTGLTTCFIPIYMNALKTDNKPKEFIDKIITLVLVFSLVVILIVFPFAQYVVKLFAFGFEGDTLYYAIWFTRISVLSVIFSTFIYVYSSYLQCNKVFLITSVSSIPNFILIIISIILGAKVNIWFLPIGSCIAVLIQLLCLIIPVRKKGYNFRFNFLFNDHNIKSFFKLFLPILIGVSITELNTLIDKTIASSIVTGGISALTYANGIVNFVQFGLVQAVVMVFYPKITNSISSNQQLEAKKNLDKTNMLLLSFLIPSSLGIIFFNKEIVNIIFYRGSFSDEALNLTSISLLYYSIGISFVGIRELLSRYFYAHKDTKTPMIIASIGMVINIVLNLILPRFMGLGGLALATSISSFVSAILLMICCKKKFGNLSIKIDFLELLKIILCSILSCLCAFLLYNFLSINSIIKLLISIFVAFICYFILGLLTRMSFIRILPNRIVRKKDE